MSRAAVFDRYGPPDVLNVVDVEPPVPGPGQVRVRVRAAGLQPFDVKLRRGDTAAWAPARFPQGVGSELAGTVDAVGPSVATWTPGDRVLGGSVGAAVAEYALADASMLVAVADGMSWEEAGALSASGQTAHTALRALAVDSDDTLLVHAAAGGVGSMAVQLARAWGARVIGTASDRNHQYLRDLGAEPVRYGEGLTERIREHAPDGVDVALDAIGTDEALQVSLDLVPDPRRIGTVAGQDAEARYGVRALGTERSGARLGELASLCAAGKLGVHIHAAFELDDVASAHRVVESGHVRGKVVVVID